MTPNETPTPETDHATRIPVSINPTCETEVVHADFARKLERERNELRDLLIRVVNEGTFGSAAEGVSMEFLRHVPNECAIQKAELQAYREGGVTEEILRRHDGCIKIGNGCSIVSTSELEKMKRATQGADGGDTIIGHCVEIGDDEDGQPRLVIHTTREQLAGFNQNLIMAQVEVSKVEGE